MSDGGERERRASRQAGLPLAHDAASQETGGPAQQAGPRRQEDGRRAAATPGVVTGSGATPGVVTGRGATPGVVTRQGVIAWLVLLITLGGLAAALRFEPPRGIRIPGFAKPLPELCNAQRMLGIDCPGCGLTRSFVLSAQQQWGRAFQIHPFGAMAFGFLMLLLPYRLWQASRLARGRPPRSTTVIELAVLGALAGSSVLWWVARLLSGAASGA